MISILTHQLQFPDPLQADECGLLAVGGDLSIERLLLAYAQGIFPWYNPGEPICWYAPRERCILFPQNIRVSKSMQKIWKKNIFTITSNTAFEQVIESCSNKPRPGQQGTWITPEMKQAYIQLHKAGYAKSVEVWQHKKLVGGLYGVTMKHVFCGESMFSNVANASKAALVWLCRQGEYICIDCQLPTEHLKSMGAEIISSEKYLSLLKGWISGNESKL